MSRGRGPSWGSMVWGPVFPVCRLLPWYIKSINTKLQLQTNLYLGFSSLGILLIGPLDMPLSLFDHGFEFILCSSCGCLCCCCWPTMTLNLLPLNSSSLNISTALLTASSDSNSTNLKRENWFKQWEQIVFLASVSVH